MHKNRHENFAPEKQHKRAKRTRKSQKKAKPGAFWVLERMRAVADWCKQMQNPGKLGENNGPDLSRLPPRSALDGRHRRPAPLATLRVPRFRPLPLRKRPALRMQCWSFWQGQKDLNPRHAVLETAALPTELYPYLKFCLFILSSPRGIVNCFFEKRCNVFAFLTVHPHML